MPSDSENSNGTDSDKAAWQAEQARLDHEAERAREKDAKTKARKARAAKRKVERLARELEKSGEITDWEADFTQSLSERLDKYDSAFRDPEKGGRGEALSYGQKAIVAQLKKKSKGGMKRTGFSNKKPKFTPRIRQLDEDFEPESGIDSSNPARPKSKGPKIKGPNSEAQDSPPPKGKPFLRIVKNDSGPPDI